MPVTTVATNDVLSATHFNTNYRDQVVSTVTSATRPAGTQGQVIYETDTSRYYGYTGSAWELILQQGALLTWTPTLTQSSSVTCTVTEATYQRVGRMIYACVFLTATGAGSSNAAVTISLPATAKATSAGGGSGYIADASSGSPLIPGVCRLASTTAMALLDATQAGGNVNLGQSGAAFSVALASGDSVAMNFHYITAS